MAGERLQQPPLRLRQSDCVTIAGDAASGQIDLEPIGDEPGGHLSAAVLAATEQGSDACQELVDAERLRLVVVGPQVQRLDLVAFVLADREHDDRGGRPRPEPAADLEPADRREVQVEHDQVRREALREQQGFLAVDRGLHGIPPGDEGSIQCLADLGLVVHDEDAFLPQLSAPPSAEGSVNANVAPSSGRVLDPDVAVEQRDEPLADRETQSRAQARVPVVHPVERIEELLAGLGWNAGSVVDHADRHHVVRTPDVDLDRRGAHRRRPRRQRSPGGCSGSCRGTPDPRERRPDRGRTGRRR